MEKKRKKNSQEQIADVMNASKNKIKKEHKDSVKENKSNRPSPD